MLPIDESELLAVRPDMGDLEKSYDGKNFWW
jgi:hypothetical protein